MLILNIDDDPDDRELFCDALKTIDPKISCVQVDGGEAALEFLQANKILPDFIFIDINMPQMNGYECALKIRENENLKRIPVVMFSTAFNPNDLKELSNFERLKFLTKPGQFESLVRSLKKLIS